VTAEEFALNCCDCPAPRVAAGGETVTLIAGTGADGELGTGGALVTAEMLPDSEVAGAMAAPQPVMAEKQ
jgi:hypothetical protein